MIPEAEVGDQSLPHPLKHKILLLALKSSNIASFCTSFLLSKRWELIFNDIYYLFLSFFLPFFFSWLFVDSILGINFSFNSVSHLLCLNVAVVYMKICTQLQEITIFKEVKTVCDFFFSYLMKNESLVGTEVQCRFDFRF